MSVKHYPRYVGVRLTEEEHRDLKRLIRVCNRNQSVVIRFLLHTAIKRPELVAASIEREQRRELR